MADDTDSNQLAFDRLKALVLADALLSEEVKKAITADCDSPSAGPINLRKLLFEANVAAQ